jgi:hypothetical protein
MFLQISSIWTKTAYSQPFVCAMEQFHPRYTRFDTWLELSFVSRRGLFQTTHAPWSSVDWLLTNGWLQEIEVGHADSFQPADTMMWSEALNESISE